MNRITLLFPAAALTVLHACSKPSAPKTSKESQAPPSSESSRTRSATAPPTAVVASQDMPVTPGIDEIIRDYQNYAKMTGTPVLTNRALWIQCTTTLEQIKQAELTDGPHAISRLNFFMNAPAAIAFAASKKPYPTGAVIVKDKMGEGFGGMVKRAPGYDPENGDWEYFYQDEKTPLESGRIGTCVECHRKAVENDFVFGTWREANPLDSFNGSGNPLPETPVKSR